MEMHEPLKPPRHTSPPCRDAHNLDVVVLKFTLLNFKQHRIKPPAAYTPHPDYTEALLHVIALFFCDFLVKVFFFFLKEGDLSKTVYQKKSELSFFFAGSRSGVTAAFAKGCVEESWREGESTSLETRGSLGQMRRFDIHSAAHACSQTFLSSFTDDVLTRSFNKVDKYTQVCSHAWGEEKKKGGRKMEGTHERDRSEREKKKKTTSHVR